MITLIEYKENRQKSSRSPPIIIFQKMKENNKTCNTFYNQIKLYIMKNYVLIVWLLLLSCTLNAQKAKPVPIWEFKEFKSTTDSVLIKNGLTVHLEPLSPRYLYKFPDLFTFTREELSPEFEKEYGLNIKMMFPEYEGKLWNFTLGSGDLFLVAFKVKITNNTGHILKMSDARIILKIDGENPIHPVTKFGNPTLQYQSGSDILVPVSKIENDQSLIHWVTDVEIDYENNRPKGFLSAKYPIGLNSQILSIHKKSYKMIGDVDTEIFPDESYSGILLFPVTISFPEISVRMFEFVTKRDAAGTPTEKTNFDFKYKMNNAQLWLDRNLNKWIYGEPPGIYEYKDRKTKKYMYRDTKK